MKFRSLVAGAFAVLASLILGSCGGGGAVTDPNRGGDFDIQPDGGTFFAGVVSRITISGGRMPYSLTSSEPTVLAVPQIVNTHFLDVVANNPGTVDSGLAPDALPVRTVVITARDSQGLTQTASIKIAHNFLTGYFVTFTPSTCPKGAQACAGGETIVTFDTVTNGVRFGNRPFTVSIVQGQCLFENPIGSVNLSTSVNTASDHEGKVTVALFCPPGIASQVGVLRITDVGSGASTVHAFLVSEASASQNLQAVPDKFDFVGPDTLTCGTGDAQFFVFGGLPPYFAASSDPNITVTQESDTQPGVFVVSAHNPTVCVDTTIVVVDSRLGRTTVSVKTETGSAPPPAPPAPPLTATPSSVTLSCGQSQSVLITGGATGGTLNAISNNPKVTVVVGAGSVTITRAVDLNNPVGTTTSTVTVTDGTSIITISVNNPLTCT